MRRILIAAALAAPGYAALAAVPDWGLAWMRLLPLIGGLIVAYLIGLWGVRDAGDGGRLLALVWVSAILFRVLVLFHPPTLSDDLYRYLWDGRVLLSGTNPYRFAPEAAELAPLRDALWPLINHPGLPTIYPPLLILLFAAVAAVSPTVLAWKAAMTGCDLAAALLLQRGLAARGHPRVWVLLYLWHPLPILEFAGNGHADAVGVALVALALVAYPGGVPAGMPGPARGRPGLAGLALTLAGLVKFLPWVAVPALLPRLRARWIGLPLLAAAFYLPFRNGGVNALGSLGAFANTWRSNDLLFAALLGGEPTEANLLRAKLLAGGIAGGVWVLCLALRRPWPSVYAWTLGVLLLVSPVVHPWYLLWLLPVLFYVRHPAWWLWSLTVLLAYAPLPRWRSEGIWEESLALKIWEVAPVLALLPVQILMERRRRPGR